MNRFFKNERGITLVALIITIIILIILAAVTISAVFKNNFIGIATQGTENYAEAQVNESKKMDDVAKLLQDTVSNITSITGGGSTPDSPYSPEEVESMIGKYVNYKPTPGSYWEDTDESGNTKNINDFAGVSPFLGSFVDISSNTQFNTETDLKWKIWGVNSSNLLLISDVPTTQQLTLVDAIGYNNGVTLLDNICSKCYKNNNYNGIVVKNLKIEDITKITTLENSSKNEYGTTQFSSTFEPPYIWAQYERGPLDLEGNPTSNSKAINNRSIAYKLTSNTTSSSANILPYWTLWNNENMNTLAAYSNTKYKDLIFSPSSSSEYWLSSRYVSPQIMTNGVYNRCIFGLQTVTSQAVSGRFLYDNWKTGLTNEHRSLRPLVSIPLSSCTITESTTSGMDYDISPK